MKNRTYIFIYLFLALALVAPVYFFVSEVNHAVVFFGTMASITSLSVVVLLFSRTMESSRITSALEQFGHDPSIPQTDRNMYQFVSEALRYHRAAYLHRVRGIGTEEELDLGQALSRITSLARRELEAESVELSLFEENQSLWSQNFLLGEPPDNKSQSMLFGDVEQNIEEALDFEDNPGVEVLRSSLVQPLYFAGVPLGILRVGYKVPRVIKKGDKEVIQLLAEQASVVLIDSRFTEELLRIKRLSEQSLQAKTGFLANLSHEIRGPLGIILNGIELMLAGLCGELTPPLKESLQLVDKSGQHLLELVNDVLDYAKVEAGHVSANPIKIPVKGLLEDLTTVVRSQAHTKGHTISLDGDIPKDLGVIVDKRHARQMLINYLTNAIKYTPDGGEIFVSAARLKEGVVRIAVRDTGIGIEEAQQDKVFGAFERVEDQYAESQNGTGLGMPMTKKLAEVNLGSVGFESEKGKGSTFWIDLRFCEIKSLAVQDTELDGGVKLPPQGNGEVVFIFDQDASTRSMIERYLGRQGFTVCTASHPSEILSLLNEGDIQVAIVENDFPGFPGEEIVSMIRGVPSGRSIPILLLSARAFRFDIERFLKLGVDRCLSKPVPLFEIAETVFQLISQSAPRENFSVKDES